MDNDQDKDLDSPIIVFMTVTFKIHDNNAVKSTITSTPTKILTVI